MKKIDIIFFTTSLVISITAFLATNIIFIPFGIFLVYLLYYFVLIRKRIKNYLAKVETIHACYHFVNSFIITLSVKDSLEEAYLNGLRLAPASLTKESSEIENMTILERINFLRQYFNLAIYKMFLNIIGLYVDQGGNILNISDSLIRECTRVEKDLNESSAISNRHLVEFGILWLLSFFIMIFLRFALANFYIQMLKNPLIITLICLFYLLFLLAAHLFIYQYTSLTIKEDSENV